MEMETAAPAPLSDLELVSLKPVRIEPSPDEEESSSWQPLFRSVLPTCRKKSDLLIALTHFLLTKEYRLRCTSRCSVASGPLPDHWNRDTQRYSLEYSDEQGSQQYLLLAKLSRRDLVISLQNSTSRRMFVACLQPELLVSSTKDDLLEKCIPRAGRILRRLRSDLVDPVVRGTKRLSDAPFPAGAPATKPSRVTFNLAKCSPGEESF
ncbi:proteasome inhibitor PI31 subunit [Drosophila ficusphila]|uniref:proteasome inhibitor PI31 subunit n=1 Tax=Drosophila ficusphila TaxID=30025 RepID=UPI0007E7ED95|nr:proteasome inhibitor PI31 subunit [Drosophila ficusphila]XP_017048218.1 proteasome inhibitor PI31 subunit [Drosophila ficusphila]